MAVEEEIVCPLGSECETIKDGKVIKCAWYTKLKGEDPQTGDMHDEYACAIAWMPLLTIEMSRTNRGQTQALESFRNETVKGQAIFNKLIKQRNKLIGENT